MFKPFYEPYHVDVVIRNILLLIIKHVVSDVIGN